MAKKVISHSVVNGGISDFDNIPTPPNSVAHTRSVDVRTNLKRVTLLPRTIKESSTTVTGLIKWFTYVSSSGDTYGYDENGTLYKRTSAGVTTLLRTVPNSHGNGLSYSREDDFLYYTSDKVVGRYGPLSSATPQFVDDFFGSQGG